MAKIRDGKEKMGKGNKKKALQRLERLRVRHTRAENRVTELRQRLALAEAKLTRRAARLAEAEAAFKSAAAPNRDKGRAQKGSAVPVKAEGAPQEVVAGVTTPQETVEELTALPAPAAPVADGAVSPEQAADELAASAQEQRNSARPTRSRSRRKTTSGES